MTNECIPLEALGTLEALPPEHPMRRHAETCPRCSSLAFAYAEFVRAATIGGAKTADADVRLDAFISERVEGDRGQAVPISGAPRRGRGRWFELPSFRFAMVASALVLTAAVVLRWQPWSEGEIVYRGGEQGGITVDAPRSLDDGVIELSWGAFPGADAYQVTILGADLSERVRLTPQKDLSARFDPRAAAPGAAYWQVSALREGEVLTPSAPEPLSE